VRVALCLMLTVAVLSCGKTRPDTLDITHSESVDVGGGPGLPSLEGTGLNPPGLGSGITQSFSSELGDQGAEEGDVKSVTLSLLRLEITAPINNGMPQQDLRFLDHLAMFISAQGLAEVKVAESAPAPSGSTQSASFGRGVTTVDIPLIAGVDLKDHVVADGMAARVEITANGRPALSCTVRLTTTLHVQLNPVGAAQNRLGF
jgi:hypothetical protein